MTGGHERMVREGTFCEQTFRDGTFCDGTFHEGAFREGTFCRGMFRTRRFIMRGCFVCKCIFRKLWFANECRKFAKLLTIICTTEDPFLRCVCILVLSVKKND